MIVKMVELSALGLELKIRSYGITSYGNMHAS